MLFGNCLISELEAFSWTYVCVAYYVTQPTENSHYALKVQLDLKQFMAPWRPVR